MQAKLTITLPKDLHQRAKAWAALEGTTLSDVILKRLVEYAPDWETIEDAEDVRAADEVLARIARGEEEFVDWAEVDAELEALQDQDVEDGAQGDPSPAGARKTASTADDPVAGTRRTPKRRQRTT